MRTNTHIGRIREANRTDMELVQDCLGWTHERYCFFQFREYCFFVETIAEGWPRVREEIAYSPVFRGFWNNEWARRDREEFLVFATECDDLVYNFEEYIFLNDHQRLLGCDEFMARYSNMLKIIRS